MLFDIFRKFKFITKIFALINNLISKEICQLNNVINVITIFYIVWFVYHSDIVENVIFSSDKLQ